MAKSGEQRIMQGDADEVVRSSAWPAHDGTAAAAGSWSFPLKRSGSRNGPLLVNPRSKVQFGVRCVDGLAVALGATLAASAPAVGASFPPVSPLGLAGVVAAGSLSALLGIAGRSDADTILAWPKGAYQMLLGMLLVTVPIAGLLLAFAGDTGWPLAQTLAAAAILSGALLFALRCVSAAFVRFCARTSVLTRRVAVYGTGVLAQRLLDRAATQSFPWVHIDGVYDDRRRQEPSRPHGLEVVGTLDNLVQAIRRGDIDDVVIALPWTAGDRVFGIADRLNVLPAHVYVAPEAAAGKIPGTAGSSLFQLSLVQIARPPLTGWRVFAKWLEDKSLAILMVILFSPLMALIAAAIAIESPGPVLFRQTRNGFNNRPITVYKFRTMRHVAGAERFRQATPDDPRVTRIGRMLRQSSLDELPQLFNVLGGSMSVVGPRPHVIELDRHFAPMIPGYSGRTKMKPGLTGWAQVSGHRGPTPTLAVMRSRVELDLYYIDNWSIGLDLRILLKTAVFGWMHKNAC